MTKPQTNSYPFTKKCFIKKLTQIKKTNKQTKNIQHQPFLSVLQFTEFTSLTVMQIH